MKMMDSVILQILKIDRKKPQCSRLLLGKWMEDIIADINILAYLGYYLPAILAVFIMCLVSVRPA
jgi:hypothetical protein